MRSRSLLAIILFALLCGGCSTPVEPTDPIAPSRLEINPEVVSVDPGEDLELRAVLDTSGPNAFAWSFDGGSLIANGADAIWSAPVEPGPYQVSVSVPGTALSATSSVTVTDPVLIKPGIELTPTGQAVMVTGAELTIAANVTDVDPESMVWNASGGHLEASGGTAVYTAPHVPGVYVITVSSADSGGVSESLLIDVKAILEPFTIAVIPDTQTMARAEARVEDYPPLIEGIGKWVVENVEAQNIEFVTQVGDVVWNADQDDEWTAALAGFDLLDGVVPYSVSLGDHEYEIEEDKASSTAEYVTHFGPERYQGYDWYGGAHEAGLSHYQIFEAGGREFLHLNLEWEPMGPVDDPGTPLGWARSVLEEHAHLPTFISTHAYLWDEPGEQGHFPNSVREGFFVDKGAPRITTSGVGIFEALVEPFPQVLMVFNGHYHKDTRANGHRGEYRQTSLNVAGSPVYEMLANYQWMQPGDDPDYIRLIEFMPSDGIGSDRIEVTTFSPSRNAEWGGESSNFVYELDLAQRLAFAPPDAAP